MKKLVLFITLFLLAATQADAQSWLDKVGKKVENAAKRTIERKAEQKTEEAVDKAVDKATDKGTYQGSEKDKDVETIEWTEMEPGEIEQSVGSKQDGAPKLEAYSKYDFVPGEKVVFYEDFSQDAVGDFPALWNTNGSAEVVTTNLFPGHWMRFITTNSAIWTDKLLALPENYTIEFDIVPVRDEDGEMAGYDFRLIQSINEKSYDWGAVPGKAGLLFSVEYYGRPDYRAYVNGEGENQSDMSGYKDGEQFKQRLDRKYHIAIWVQKSRVRVYQDENKLFDLPRAFALEGVKMDRIRFEEGAAMVSNVRIAVGAPDTRSKLITEGKLVTYGITFDVNKDVVKPESYGTLKSIADVLKENPDVKVKIVGHTDSDGADDANLDLSKRRAASVKNELAKTFGIDAGRMETDGKGETEPVAPNTTPEGKASNRRVEFVKQ